MINQNFARRYLSASKGHYTFDDSPIAFIKDENNVVTEDHLKKIIFGDKSKSSEIIDAMDHPSMTSGVIGALLEPSQPSLWLKRMAIQHDKATPEQLQTVLGDKDSGPASYGLKSYAMNNKNLTSDNITAALNDPEPSIRISAMEHPKAEEKHFKAGLNDPDYRVNASASRRLRSLARVHENLDDPMFKDEK